MITVQATLVDTRDGSTAVFETEYITADPDVDEDVKSVFFHWTDGNYGCDCNRSLFMGYGFGDKSLECSRGGKKVIRLDALVIKETGYEIYRRKEASI